MQSAFGTVVWIVCGVGLVAGLLFLIGTSKAWEEYGKSRLVMDGDPLRGPRSGPAAAATEREVEIRQLLEARNARRIRRGETPLDVDAELEQLTAPKIDAQLRSEIRDLVVARNARRVRAGKPPLSVDTETEREIVRLSKLL